MSTVVGTLVHNRPLQEGECQIVVDTVYEGCETVPAHVNSGEGNFLKNYVDSVTTWLVYHLMKM